MKSRLCQLAPPSAWGPLGCNRHRKPRIRLWFTSRVKYRSKVETREPGRRNSTSAALAIQARDRLWRRRARGAYTPSRGSTLDRPSDAARKEGGDGGLKTGQFCTDAF